MTSRSFVIPLPDLQATARLGAALIRLACPGDVLALWGEPGVGKSTLARAVVRALTAPDEDVPSPTFTLVRTYTAPDPTRPPLWHFDFHRLDHPDDALALDLNDAFTRAISLIEEPERLGPWLPGHRLDIRLVMDNAAPGRLAHLTPHGPWAERFGPAFWNTLA